MSNAIECNADLDHPCDANDGEPCEKCAADLEAEYAYWREQWQRSQGYYRDCCGAASGKLCEPGCDGGDAQYRQDMIDAGRGHLLGPR